MQNEYAWRHLNVDRDRFPEIDREVQKQELIMRYRRLKRLKESDLSLDDQFFLENFKVAMRIYWGVTLPHSTPISNDNHLEGEGRGF